MYLPAIAVTVFLFQYPSRGLKEKRMESTCAVCYHLSSLTFSLLSSSSTFYPTLWVSKILHWTAGLYPMCCGLRGLAHHDHLAEGWPANPSEPRGDHRQHWLHELLTDFQSLPHAQWELHLHRPEWGRGGGAPKPADCERWGQGQRVHGINAVKFSNAHRERSLEIIRKELESVESVVIPLK